MRICHCNNNAIFGLSLGIGLLAIAPAALSHGVDVSHSSGEAVRVHALFDSGEPMSEAQVSVFAPDEAQTPWVTGTTDPAGNFAFVPDPTRAGRWEVQVRLAGHGEIVYVPLEESSVADVTSESATFELASSETPADTIASPPRSLAGLAARQKLVMGAVFAWGCIGTALYFKRGKTT